MRPITSRVRGPFLALLLACAMIVAAALWIGETPQRVEVAPGEAGPMPRAVVTEPPVAIERETAVASTAGEIAVEAAERERDLPAPPAQTGSLALRVVDAHTARDLEEVELRLQSGETRLVKERISSPIELRVNPGNYRGSVRARGRDPVDVAELSIAAGQRTDLGVLKLHRGSAILTGRVISAALPGHAYDLELYGDGRGPCDLCVEPAAVCETCGYSAGSSVRAAAPTGEFRFERLAAFTYRLVARERESRVIAIMVKVALSPGEARHVDLRIDGEGLLLIELVDEFGVPFDGVWPEPHGLVSAPIRFHFGAAGGPIAECEVAGLYDGVAEAPSASLENVKPRAGEVAPRPGDPQGAEGARRITHSVSPRLFPAGFEIARLPATRIDGGLYRVRDVTRQADSVVASCGPFFSIPVTLPVDRLDGHRVRIQLLGRCSALDLLSAPDAPPEAAAVSCTDCHQLPAQVLFKDS